MSEGKSQDSSNSSVFDNSDWVKLGGDKHNGIFVHLIFKYKYKNLSKSVVFFHFNMMIIIHYKILYNLLCQPLLLCNAIGANELLSTRKVTSVRFSDLNPNLV